MKLSHLQPSKGSVSKRKRLARGQGSGWGGTAGRGHKGDGSRSGAKLKRNFEGGQMPLQMRLPKIGFKNPTRVEFIPLNLGRIQDITEKYGMNEISPASLYEKGIIRKTDRIKILAHGELKSKISVTAHAASASAKEKIEQLGGSLTTI